MSRGSKIVHVRLSQETIASIIDAVDSANQSRRGAPYDFSAWVRAAIAEKLSHLKRSRRRLAGNQTATTMVPCSNVPIGPPAARNITTEYPITDIT